jgi:hypothetical protein
MKNDDKATPVAASVADRVEQCLDLVARWRSEQADLLARDTSLSANSAAAWLVAEASEVQPWIRDLTKLRKLLADLPASHDALRRFMNVDAEVAVTSRRYGGQRILVFTDRPNPFLAATKALIDAEGSATAFEAFVDTATRHGLAAPDGTADRKGATELASLILAASFPDRFFPWRYDRVNQLARAFAGTVLDGPYADRALVAGDILRPAAEALWQRLGGKPDVPPLWLLAGVGAWLEWGKKGLLKQLAGAAPLKAGPPAVQITTRKGMDTMRPLNLILHGPPGTGKTYTTINKALEILDPDYLATHKHDRPALKTRFDELATAGRIEFVTFHQSFAYEDFVEGIRATTDADGHGVDYRVEDGVFKTLCERAALDAAAATTLPHVLIIDEINRGNISRIFGELITLIEPSKRRGAAEALTVTLPYSKRAFSVPQNLYLIATMNTADRSLTALDNALRRRFKFEEMPPKPELLDGVTVDGVNIGEMLRVMNQRIEVLFDRDHCLGHTYLLPLEKRENQTLENLESIFRHEILPLLQEYFFEDWEKIAWVLNDHRKKSEKHKFVRKPEKDTAKLFGDAMKQVVDRRWTVQTDAFKQIESYRYIIDASTSTPDPATAAPTPAGTP